MKKALLVARWEFVTTVTRRAYIFSVIGMPVLLMLLGGMTTLSLPGALRTAVNKPTALVDKAGIVDLAFANARAEERDEARRASGNRGLNAPNRLEPFDDTQAALDAMKDERVSAVYVIEADYLQTGNITSYGRNLNALNRMTDLQRVNAVTDAIRASLLKSSFNGETFLRAYAPTARVKMLNVSAAGKTEDASSSFNLGRVTGTLGIFVLFTMSIFFSAGFLQQATVEDRQNRTFEVLLSSLDAGELLMGKIIGLGAAGLLQVALYVTLIVLPGNSMLADFHVPVATLALLFVYFSIGYLQFACPMTTAGMITRTPQEGAQLSAIWTLSASFPMFFMPAISAAPNGLLARALSFFPLTSPMTMMFRILTLPELPLVDIAVSIAIDAASVYVCLWAAVKIFRAATLMYGKRATLPELVRWLRA